jgi:hypothetical protein
MGYIKGELRDQQLLSPEVIDDHITADSPVRFIGAFVENLNIKELSF